MTVSDNYTVVKQLGNGSTTAFGFSWTLLNEDFIRVYLEDVVTGVQTLQTITTDYTLTFGDSSGTVTFLTAPTSDDYVVIARSVSLDQTDPYTTSKGFQGDVVEDSFDKVTLQNQDQEDAITRSITFKLGSSTTGVNMPEPEASKVVQWNAAGDDLENGVTTTDIENAASNAAAAAASASAASASETAAAASAVAAADSAASVNLPNSLIGQAGKHLEVNSGETGYDLVPQSGMVKLSSVDISPITATVDFSGIDNTYRAYMFVLTGIELSTTSLIAMLVSTDGGSSFITTSSYEYIVDSVDSGAVAASTNSVSNNHMRASFPIMDTSSSGLASGTVHLYDPSNTSTHTFVESVFTFPAQTSLNAVRSRGAAAYNATTAVDAFRFYPLSGTFDAGNITMYGLV